MSINIDRHFDRAMSQLVLHIGQGFTVLNEQRCERVTQIVEADSPELRLLQTLQKDSIFDVLHVEGFTFRTAHRLSFFPNNLTGTEEDPSRNFVLSFC